MKYVEVDLITKFSFKLYYNCFYTTTQFFISSLVHRSVGDHTRIIPIAITLETANSDFPPTDLNINGNHEWGRHYKSPMLTSRCS